VVRYFVIHICHVLCYLVCYLCVFVCLLFVVCLLLLNMCLLVVVLLLFRVIVPSCFMVFVVVMCVSFSKIALFSSPVLFSLLYYMCCTFHMCCFYIVVCIYVFMCSVLLLLLHAVLCHVVVVTCVSMLFNKYGCVVGVVRVICIHLDIFAVCYVVVFLVVVDGFGVTFLFLFFLNMVLSLT
jgi:hypothetical protein